VSAVWHSAKNSERIFAECRPGDTRQRLLCRVPAIWHSAKRILKLKKNLCRVPDHGHSAKHAYIPTVSAFFLILSLSHSLTRRRRCSRRRTAAAVPLTCARSARRACSRARTAVPLTRAHRARRARARAAVPLALARARRAPRRAPAHRPRCSPAIPPSCPRPTGASAATRRLARDPSNRPRPIKSPATKPLR
jgi:hypothetical protein